MSKKYSLETKLKAVKMYLEDGIGITTIAMEPELSSENRVLLWVNRYKEFGESGLEERRGKYKGINKGRPRKQELTLEQENEKLRAEVEYLKKLILIGRL